MSEFSAGPPLSDTPLGDPKRQAVDSLRGYAYQLYVSALAWIRLEPGQKLFLEVAEDYAVVARDALRGVQVKDTAKSGSLTINNEAVTNALDSFVQLTRANPDLQVSLHFLTTSRLGKERELADRIEGRGVLDYWRSAAASADVQPLRKALLNANISGDVRTFIKERDDTRLREELLKRIHWDCLQDDLAGVGEELEASLIEFGSDRLRLTPTDCRSLSKVVVAEVLSATVKQNSKRRLMQADLLSLCEAHSMTAVSTVELNRLASTAAQLLAMPASTALQLPSLLESMEDIPLPPYVAPREKLVKEALLLLCRGQLLFLAGGSGLGKTTAARLTARDYGGRWMILDLRDVAAPEAASRIESAIAEVSTQKVDGVVLDDLNALEAQQVQRQLARLRSALRRRDGACIITCYRHPNAAIADGLGEVVLPILEVKNLSMEEVRDLVQLAGGASEQAAVLAFFGGGQGHPQLVRAFIDHARRIGWEALERNSEAVSEEVRNGLQSDVRRLRQSLVTKFDKDARRLLYRLSLLIGRFERRLALQVAEVEPAIDLADEGLEALTGPCIDELGKGQLRVSPLLQKAGEEALSADEQRLVHRHAAKVLTSGNEFDVARAESVFQHAMLGGEAQVLLGLAFAVISTNPAQLKIVADWMPGLRQQQLSEPICASNAVVSRALRFAQAMLMSETEDIGRRLATWDALCKEMAGDDSSVEAMNFEYLVLSRALSSSGLARILQNPMQLMERHHQLTRENERFHSIVSDMDAVKHPESGSPVSVSGLFFVTAATEVGSVARQRSLFVELAKLSSEARRRYLSEPANSPSGLPAIVNAGWLAEVRAGALDWEQAADIYLELAELAMLWVEVDLALHFYVARCIMFDEYGKQPDAALQVLSNAEEVLGRSAIISRARAKVHFKSRRFAEALAIAEEDPESLGMHDPVERLFLCRETAISASHAGGWEKCQAWLNRALSAAALVPRDAMQALRIGLLADHAVASYVVGDHGLAITEIRQVLEALPDIENDTSIQSIYCQRVVRHALLWMYAQASDGRRGIEVDGQPPRMVAGMCSNPEPPDSIRQLPIGSLVTAWHMLAAVDSRHVGSTVARIRLDEKIGRETYPALESMTRNSLLENAIRRLDVDEIASTFPLWLDICAHLIRHGKELRAVDPLAPKSGEVPSVSSEELQSEGMKHHLRDFVQSIAVSAAISDRRDAVRTLVERLSLEPQYGECVAILSLIDGQGSASSEPTKAEHACLVARAVLRGEALTHDELFVATLRFAHALQSSAFQYALEKKFVGWAKRRWQAALAAPFGFKAPNANLPAITAALELEGLSGLAEVILVSERALDVKLSAEVRDWLKQLSGRSV